MMFHRVEDPTEPAFSQPKLTFTQLQSVFVTFAPQVTMTTAENEDQYFDVAGRPEADHVNITVVGSYTTGTNNGFSNILFLGEKGITR